MSEPTILILSDKPASVATWMDAFQQSGLETTLTITPKAARCRWLDAAPLLTVVDLDLSVLKCLKICRELRASGDAPILLILSSANGDDILEAYRAGATECLAEPASPAVAVLKALAWSMRSNWATAIPVWDWPQGAPVEYALSESVY